MPQGRPTLYTPEMVDRICERMRTSTLGLDSLCDASDDLPGASTVWRWIDENPEFRERIQRAREQQADFLAFDGLNLLRNTDPTGENAGAVVALAKATAEYGLKLVPKIAPRTMGDERRINLGGQPGNPLKTESVSVAVDPDALPEADRAALLRILHRDLQGA